MTELKIKFSHDYYKFTVNKLPFSATLVQCFKINYKDLSRCFVAYDIAYDEGDCPLPKTDLIVLLLMDNEKRLFTTARRYTPDKWKHYKKHEGESFKLVKGEKAHV